MERKLKIALGDLRHETVGRHSVYIPIGIGYIASYVLSQFESSTIEVRLYTNPFEMINEIGDWKPDIIGLANYCWNSSLSDLVCGLSKKKNPQILCVQGGPEFPRNEDNCRDYLIERPEIDFYGYADGESAFANLVGRFITADFEINKLKSEPIDGMMCIHPAKKELLIGSPKDRFKDMDEIPSPYLSGLLDNFLNNNYIPSMETRRGCPFRCAYCHTGQEKPKNISTFSVERIKDELRYIQSRVANISGSRTLAIHDSNWGMYDSDYEIAEYIASLIRQYDWPKNVEISSGKEHHDRSLRIMKLTNNRIPINLSLQSSNPKTLKVIQRTNLSQKKYMNIVNELKKNGQPPQCELIIPMPEETKQSYFDGQKYLIEEGVNTGTYTLMMLKGTLISSSEFREKYGLKTKYRILPKQFGEYCGEKCFEVEEVCAETHMMPYEDYLECRGFSYLAEIFSYINFDIIRRHLKELNLSFYEYIHFVMNTIRSRDVFLSEIYSRFTKEATDELFDSKAAVYEYFCKPENYCKLIRKEKGDNLLRKYLSEFFLLDASLLFEFAYSMLRTFSGEKITPEISDSLDAARQWASHVITINSVFNDVTTLHDVVIMNLSYDVQSWYQDSNNSKSLLEYKMPVKYKISYDHKSIDDILYECRELFGEDKSFQLGKFLSTRSNVTELWRNCCII